MGIVVGIDGCLYGIPFSSKRIVKFNPIDQTTSFVGKEAQEKFMCGNGVLGRDGYIYAANTFGHVLRIDTVNNSYDFVGGAVMTSHKDKRWGEPVLGIDGCIYWPPHNATHVLKFNPETNETSLVGDNLGNASMKYISGALAPDGAVCCIPANATQVLIIDPSMEFLMQFKADMKQHPIEFGLLFEKNNTEDIIVDTCCITCFIRYSNRLIYCQKSFIFYLICLYFEYVKKNAGLYTSFSFSHRIILSCLLILLCLDFVSFSVPLCIC